MVAVAAELQLLRPIPEQQFIAVNPAAQIQNRLPGNIPKPVALIEWRRQWTRNR
jgi:hypothetical protein